MGESLRTFSIVLPRDMYARVKRLAKSQERRLGPQIRVILERYLPELESEVAEAKR